MKTILFSLAALVVCAASGFGQWQYCVVETAPLVKSDVVLTKTGEEKMQFAYATDTDGTNLVKEVPDNIAPGAKMWYRMPDGHEILFGVPWADSGSQLAYGVDDDGTKLVKRVTDTIAPGAKMLITMPDGHEVTFWVPKADSK